MTLVPALLSLCLRWERRLATVGDSAAKSTSKQEALAVRWREMRRGANSLWQKVLRMHCRALHRWPTAIVVFVVYTIYQALAIHSLLNSSAVLDDANLLLRNDYWVCARNCL